MKITNVRLMLVLLLVAHSLIGLSCTRSQAPTDQEVVKAIDDSGILKRGGFTVTSPIVVVEKGMKKEEDGSWAVKTKFTVSMQGMDGQTRQMETTTKFRIYRSEDKNGNPIWTAKLKP